MSTNELVPGPLSDKKIADNRETREKDNNVRQQRLHTTNVDAFTLFLFVTAPINDVGDQGEKRENSRDDGARAPKGNSKFLRHHLAIHSFNQVGVGDGSGVRFSAYFSRAHSVYVLVWWLVNCACCGEAAGTSLAYRTVSDQKVNWAQGSGENRATIRPKGPAQRRTDPHRCAEFTPQNARIRAVRGVFTN